MSGERSLEAIAAGGIPTGWSLRDVYRAVFRFWRRGLLCFAVVMLLACGGVVFSPRKYTSEAWLFVRMGRESVSLDPTATTGTVVPLNVTREAEINSIIEVMGSRLILQKVVAKIGLDAPARSDIEREERLAELGTQIDIWSPKNSSVIGVACRARSPQRAQQVASTLVEVYLAEHVRLNSNPGAYQFFDEQTRLLKTQLDEANRALRDAKSRFQLSSVEGRRESLQEQMTAVERQILETQASLSATKAKIDAYQTTLAHFPEPLVHELASANRATGGMRGQLYDLQTREQELLAKFTEAHPAVMAIREQVHGAEGILQAERPDRAQATSAAVLAETATYESLVARATSLQTQRDGLAGELTRLNDQEVQISELDRQSQVAERNYLNYVASLEQSRIDQALKREQISNINIIQPASLVLKPTSPKAGLTLAVALLVALCGGGAVALLSDQLDHSLKTPEEIEQRLGLPVLVSIPCADPQQLVLQAAR
jgi:uncharacterized protein involved in exopolysaccharide biosynthesis